MHESENCVFAELRGSQSSLCVVITGELETVLMSGSCPPKDSDVIFGGGSLGIGIFHKRSR